MISNIILVVFLFYILYFRNSLYSRIDIDRYRSNIISRIMRGFLQLDIYYTTLHNLKFI